ncbi:MAG: hypothetical protein SW833_16460 [Cyanobacteriota bacterium]|nr:hypothetical protein [Cyanobacteriota bacterium]
MGQSRKLTWKQHLTYLSCAAAFVFSLAAYQQEMTPPRSRSAFRATSPLQLALGRRDNVSSTPARVGRPAPERFRPTAR